MRVALAALLVLGCDEPRDATVATCAAPTECPNERVAPFVNECADASADPTCGAKYREYFACRREKQICDGRGKLDQDASVAACASAYAAWSACSAPPPGDGGVDTGADTASVPSDSAVVDTGVDATVDATADAGPD